MLKLLAQMQGRPEGMPALPQGLADLVEAGEESPEGFIAILGALAAVMCGILLVSLVIQVVVAYLLSSALVALPEHYRQQEPNLVWLLLIPLFNLVWNFFVYPKVSASYRAYFEAQGATNVGDAGRGVGLAFCICVIVATIPTPISSIAGLAALVLLIIYLVQIHGLKQRVLHDSQTPPPPQ